jgi:HEAT repeat protein
MTNGRDNITRWLQTRPFQDNPVWVESLTEETSGTWDEWVKTGREIPHIENDLIRMLELEGDPVIRSSATLALGFVGGDQSVAALIKALETDVPIVAMEAAASLGRLGRYEAIKPLCDALQNSDSNVRANAATALGLLGGEKAVSCLKSAEKDKDPFVQAAAKEALRGSK